MLAVAVLERVFQLFAKLKDFVGVGQRTTTRVTEHQATSLTVEQGLAQLLLQQT